MISRRLNCKFIKRCLDDPRRFEPGANDGLKSVDSFEAEKLLAGLAAPAGGDVFDDYESSVEHLGVRRKAFHHVVTLSNWSMNVAKRTTSD